MSSHTRTGPTGTTRWTSGTGHKFTARHVGKGIYEGYAVGADGAWSGAAEAAGYITLDGTVQTIEFKVEGNHRPTMWEFIHTDGTNPSAANYNLYVDYHTRGTYMWHELYGHAVDESTHLVPFGETYERLTSTYRIQLQGTAGHFIYITPRMQLMALDQTKRKESNP